MTIFIVDIEAVETRYTAQWKKHLPRQIERNTNCKVVTISGGETPQATTPGAFLNFGGTNVYKSKQLEIIAEKLKQTQENISMILDNNDDERVLSGIFSNFCIGFRQVQRCFLYRFL